MKRIIKILTLAFFLIASLNKAPQVFASTLVYVLCEYSETMASGNISVIDVANSFSVIQIAQNLGTFQTASASPDQTKIYVSDRWYGFVYAIDTETHNVLASIQVSNDGEIAITPDGKKGYITTRSPDNVLWVLDLEYNNVKGSISGIGGYKGLAMSPDGSKLYVAPNGKEPIQVVDVLTDTVIATIPVYEGADRLVVSPNNPKLYVASFSGVLYIVDTETNEVTKALTVGQGLWGMDITPDGSKVYITNYELGKVFVIDTTNETVMKTIDLGEGNHPSMIDVAPDGTQAFVIMNYDYGPAPAEVGVIDVSTDALSEVISLSHYEAWATYYLVTVDRDFIPVDTVAIDIKPGSYPNSINFGSKGNVPVAIFSTATFDATTVDPLTVTLEGASVKLKGKGTPMAMFEDVNGDGLLDIVVHVDTTALELTAAETEAVLEGGTFDGIKIRGVDTVRVIE